MSSPVPVKTCKETGNRLLQMQVLGEPLFLPLVFRTDLYFTRQLPGGSSPENRS